MTRLDDMKKAQRMQEEKENELQKKYYNLKCEKERLEKILIATSGN